MSVATGRTRSLAASRVRRHLAAGRWLGLGLTVGLLLQAVEPACAADDPDALTPASIGVAWVGFSKWAGQSMNVNDVGAAFKAFILTVSRKHGYRVSIESDVFDEIPVFESALRQRAINLVVIDGFSYLEMRSPELLKPAFVGSLEDKVGFQYCLVTKRGGGFDTVPDLRGRDIMQGWIPSSSEGTAWLETLLATRRLGPSSSFFGKIEVATKPAAAVLPVFFGAKAACIVDRGGFDRMSELNPQVGKVLQVIAASETIVDHLICLRASEGKPTGFDAELDHVLGELHREVVGQQILTLFKVDRLVPFQPTHLESVKRLRAAYDQVRRESKP